MSSACTVRETSEIVYALITSNVILDVDIDKVSGVVENTLMKKGYPKV